MYIASFANEARDSALALSHALDRSSSFQIALIPFPPPPAEAFNITGYPIFFANLFASFRESNIPFDPGIVGTLALFIVSLADDLSPILFIISALAPMNFIPCSSQICENFEFSDKKPYPG